MLDIKVFCFTWWSLLPQIKSAPARMSIISVVAKLVALCSTVATPSSKCEWYENNIIILIKEDACRITVEAGICYLLSDILKCINYVLLTAIDEIYIFEFRGSHLCYWWVTCKRSVLKVVLKTNLCRFDAEFNVNPLVWWLTFNTFRTSASI